MLLEADVSTPDFDGGEDRGVHYTATVKSPRNWSREEAEGAKPRWHRTGS
jgi:hypothetical protein